MSEFHVEVIKVQNIQKHPNADSLSMATTSSGYPILFKNGDYQENDLAVYVPIDSIVPDSPEWAFLNGSRRIKAKRLRGIFSMGLLMPIKPGMAFGDNVQEIMGITKHEPDLKLVFGGENESPPDYFSHYTDIEGYRRFPDVLQDGEEVIITEKLHGTSARYLFKDNRLWVGSHHCVKRHNPDNLYWQIAIGLELESRLAKFPNIAIYGEIYGNGVQDLKYGETKPQLRLFDALDTDTNKYLDYTKFMTMVAELGLVSAPVLTIEPWSKSLLELANGNTTLMSDGAHCREGIVIKPTTERWDPTIGRVILKYISEGYLLRKSA